MSFENYAKRKGIPYDPVNGWWNWETFEVFNWLPDNTQLNLEGIKTLEDLENMELPEGLIESFNNYKGDISLINWQEIFEEIQAE